MSTGIIIDPAFEEACDAARNTPEYLAEKAAADRENVIVRNLEAALEEELERFPNVSRKRGFVRWDESHDAMACFVIGNNGVPKCIATNVPRLSDCSRLFLDRGIRKHEMSVRLSTARKKAKMRQRYDQYVAATGLTPAQVNTFREAVSRMTRLLGDMERFAAFLPSCDWHAPETLRTSMASLSADLTFMRDATQRELDGIEAKLVGVESSAVPTQSPE